MQVGRQAPGGRAGKGAVAYASTLACLRHVLATEGPAGLARGVGATMARETPGNAIFFVSYEALRRMVPGRPATRSERPGAPLPQNLTL